MALGRSVGDTLTIRFGAAVLVRIACSLAAIGLVLALPCAWMPAVLFGLGLVGLGLSVPFPLVLSAAGHLSSSTIATVTTWGYAGMIVGPSMIGFLADRVGVRLALAPVVLLCVLAALCATALKEDEGSLPDREQTSSYDEDRSCV